MRHRPATTILLIALAASLVDGAAAAADPTTADCLAASDASLALGNRHALRAERSQLLVCTASSCPADVRRDCARRVDEVNAQIPTIVFSAKDAARGDLSAVKVTMDGEVLTDRLEGTALSIDPGEHVFHFETAGLPPMTRRLVVIEAQKDRRETVTFGQTAPAAPVIPAAGASPEGLPSSPGPATQPPGDGSTQRLLSIVAGVVGVAGLGVGTAFGLVALSRKNAAEAACPGACQTQSGADDWSRVSAAGNVATVGFVVAGVALAGAAALWLTAPGSGGRTDAQVGLGLGTLGVRGSW